MKPDPDRTGFDEILRRVRTAVANPALAADRRLPGETRLAGETEFLGNALVARWQQEFRALSGHAYGPLTPAAAIGQARDLLVARGAHEVLAWDDEALPVPNLSQALAAVGIETIHPQVNTDPAALDHVAVGITGASAGLADTGSIIVTSGPGRPRSASLVPPVYLAFLPISRIYPDLPAWMAQEGARLLPGTANLVIITGPSRTADIELTLIIGVHGPGEIHVILIDETAADDPIG